MALTYTNIQHQFRKENNLSLIEYCLCDMVYFLSTSPKSSAPGWCYMSKNVISDELGIARSSVFNLIDKMIVSGFIEKDNDTKFLKTTPKWYEVYSYSKNIDSPEIGLLVHKEDLNSPNSGPNNSPNSGLNNSPNFGPNNNRFNNNRFNNNNENVYIDLLSNSFEIFSNQGINGVFFEKMKDIHSMSSKNINDAYQKWVEKNESIGTNFKDEKHIKASFNKFLELYEPEKERETTEDIMKILEERRQKKQIQYGT